MQHEKYLIGRQPILNRNQNLVGYELLFRSAGSHNAMMDDASYATASVIVNTLTGFGVEDILGKHKGFINLELELLMDDSLKILPRDQVVIELLETIVVTPELVDRCRDLKQAGFTLALDDHEYSPLFQPLYDVVDIVKVDLMQSSLAGLEEMVGNLKRYPLQLLAEKVETQEEFKHCLDLGFHLFQGYYFARPSIMEKKRMDHSGSTNLKLMRLLREDADMDEIEGIFRLDPGLTYKLLLLVNSVGVGTRERIETVRHAISILGRQQIKRWVQLSLFANGNQSGMENPLMDMAAVRACVMENLAGYHHTLKRYDNSGEMAFMTGILSILDKAYDIPMSEVVRNLNLPEEVSDALRSRQGMFGKLLQVAESLEQLEFGHLGAHLNEMGVTIEDVLESQKRAYTWHKGMG